MKNFNFTKCLKDLFNLNRSITGKDTLKTLNYFKKINKDLKIIKFKSGSNVFDWKIPLEWNVKDAFIKHLKTNKKFAEFKKNNLHLVGYSIPINMTLDLKDLKKKIYFHKISNAIPYITSYYKKDWGFCLTKNQFNKLPKGKYKIKIDSQLKKGYMNGAHAIIKGKSKKEILFSSYVCHPSMANNELSGPILLNAVLKYLKDNFKNTHYTYRFILMPETIGSIAYLSKYHKYLKKNVFAAFNLSCVGDGRNYSMIESRSANTIADKALKCQIIKKKKNNIYSFLDRGSDERQYCSPGIDLPMSTFCRSKFGEFREYHTSLDNLKLVNEKNLKESLNVLKNIIQSFELGLYPSTKVKCEPMMSKKNLYPTLSKVGNYSKYTKDIMNFMAYSDSRSIFDMSIITGIELEKIIEIYRMLVKSNLIKRNFEKENL